MKSKSSTVCRWRRGAAFVAVLAGSGLFAAGDLPIQAQPPSTPKTVFDSRAQQILQRMAESYAQLPVFEQETEFSAALIPLAAAPLDPLLALPDPTRDKPPASPPEPGKGMPGGTSEPGGPPAPQEQKSAHRMRLFYAQPNRLRMEMIEEEEKEGKTQVSTWISDGKFFWSYNPTKNLYTKEKAPSRLRDFGRLTYLNNGSLELLMLMGVNPFSNLSEQVDSLRYAGKETVNGIETEVVVLEADAGPQKTEVRLYIGAEDHLLRRMVSETTPKAPAPKHQGVGSPLDELGEGTRPASPTSLPLPTGQEKDPPDEAAPTPVVPMINRVTYDNSIRLSPRFDSQTFAYTPPRNASYQTIPDPNRKPLTLKQRLAQLSKIIKGSKNGPPRTIRF